MFNQIKISSFLNISILLWCSIFFAIILHLALSFHNNPGFWTDNFIYLLQADYFLNWGEKRSPVLNEAIAYRSYPPLYPYFLSLIGAGSENIIRANIATSLLLLPVGLFYVGWQVKEGVGKINALINALLFLLLPSGLLFSTELWSENLYLLFVFLCLWGFSKSNKNCKTWIYFAALTCGLAIITRSVGVSLAMALLISIYREDKSKIMFSAILIIMPSLIWALLSHNIDYNETYMNEGFLIRNKSLLSIDGNYFNNLISNIFIQLQTLWWSLQIQFNNFTNNGTAVLVFFLLITTSVSLYRRFISLSLDALYFIFYVGIIFFWNFPDQNVRFMYVLMPLIFFYSQKTLLMLPVDSKRIWLGVKKLSIPFFIFITMYPNLVFMSDRMINSPGVHIKLINNDRLWLTNINRNETYKKLIYKEILIESTIEIKKFVPKDECVYSVFHEIVMFYAKRESLPIATHYIGENLFLNQLTECRYIFVIAAPHKNYEPMYPIDRVKNISTILNQSFYPTEFGGGIISVLLELDKNIEK